MLNAIQKWLTLAWAVSLSTVASLSMRRLRVLSRFRCSLASCVRRLSMVECSWAFRSVSRESTDAVSSSPKRTCSKGRVVCYRAKGNHVRTDLRAGWLQRGQERCLRVLQPPWANSIPQRGLLSKPTDWGHSRGERAFVAIRWLPGNGGRLSAVKAVAVERGAPAIPLRHASGAPVGGPQPAPLPAPAGLRGRRFWLYIRRG